ncbi:hypothetical protein AB4Z09_20660 [Rhodococcus sp. TAF43]|uniref:hypothetical protein n=1 Tax=unclassified Rhodococcus (in: high G+C Gram-positive bacteria) TaxID=192944 RepID=UPI000E0B7B37|nr:MULTISPECIES: hypothetical protein [unclassified Rhodococcus (in: high G+C Gram-positive bacteria)]QKT09616.1 hypothetical protein HUN07_01700 [Rhodococcus sp. W8901]RDI17237.1 hypothetical protein DEU38_12373 [Rhodococcus sp. AG1013]
MTVVNMKVTRQKLMQSAVLTKIDREHLSVDTDKVRRNLDTIRQHVSRGPLMTSYMDRWEQIVRDNDIKSFRNIVDSDDETAKEMRNLSPLSVLLDEDERLQVLDDLRDLLKR